MAPQSSNQMSQFTDDSAETRSDLDFSNPATGFTHLQRDNFSNSFINGEIRRPPKPARTREACTYCREKKTRCDGGKPCGKCQETNTDCIYTNAINKRKRNDQDEDKRRLHDIREEIQVVMDTFYQWPTSMSQRIIQELDEKLGQRHPRSFAIRNATLSSMPTIHFTAVDNLPRHDHGIKFLETKANQELKRRLRRLEARKQDHHIFTSQEYHCDSRCRERCQKIVARRTPEQIFRSFVENVYVLHPFFPLDHHRKSLRQMIDEEDPPSASQDYSNCLSPTGPSDRHLNDDSTARPGETEPGFQNNLVDQAKEPITLLIFALGLLCDRRGDACSACCIPGLWGFRRAVEILSTATETTLPYANAYLLAALYANHRNEPDTGIVYIEKASQILEPIMKDPKRSLGLLDGNRDNESLNFIRFTYWTWFQLASDTGAELRFTISEISEFADRMPFPRPPENFSAVTSEYPGLRKAITYYREQISLRMLLNRIHATIYGQPPSEEDNSGIIEEGHKFRKKLSEWRESLPPNLQWNDRDPPALDINDARLRGKYYGASVITSRPCLFRVGDAEHNIPTFDRFNPPDQEILDKLTRISRNVISDCSPLCEDAAQRLGIILNLDSKVILEAFQCIEDSKKSTCAFDNVPGFHSKLNVTNIFGTMQAQYGNVLVLASTFKRSKYLSRLISEEEMKELLSRTIEFMRRCGWNSERIGRSIFKLQIIQELVVGGSELWSDGGF